MTCDVARWSFSGCVRLRLGLTAGEQEARGQSSDTGVARHDGITTGRCAAVVRLNTGLNLRPARPARLQRLHFCQHPSRSSAVNHLLHQDQHLSDELKYTAILQVLRNSYVRPSYIFDNYRGENTVATSIRT